MDAVENARPIEEDFGRASASDPSLLRRGLSKTRGGMIARLADILRGTQEIDPALLQEIEEVLLTSDVGVNTTRALIDRMQERLKNRELSDADKVWGALRAEAQKILGKGGRIKLRGKPTVVMLVGVNGSGKTTTIGKLASKLRAQGKSVVLGAGDTFRAAAVQQLEVWGEREGARVIKGKEQADPASVLFEAVNHAKDTGADVVLCDTAGRLHTKTNLMEELSKVRRTIAKALEGAPHETLLVLDATNGQNALQQARQFQEAIELTGVVLTKLDGTAKGGVILSIADELKLPVRYIGIGERPADLREFDGEEFVEALFASRDALSTEAA
ncbi:MAG: signal recognition particle-docking protein FtsY [Polyangiales bacterium]